MLKKLWNRWISVGRTPPEIEGSLTDEERALFDWKNGDYNEIYGSAYYKGTVIGMIADEFIRQGFDLNRLKTMSLDDFGDGAGGEDEKPEPPFHEAWAREHGGFWVDWMEVEEGDSKEFLRYVTREVLLGYLRREIKENSFRQCLYYLPEAAQASYFSHWQKGLGRDVARAHLLFSESFRILRQLSSLIDEIEMADLNANVAILRAIFRKAPYLERWGRSRDRCGFALEEPDVYRVFSDEDSFRRSPLFDRMPDIIKGDPTTNRAIWPGKNRSQEAEVSSIPCSLRRADKGICGCQWKLWEPPKDEDPDDPWVQFRRRGKEGPTQEDNRRAFQEERQRFREENPHLFKSEKTKGRGLD